MGCLTRITCARQTVMVGEDLEITAYYAGHVLGAAMFRVRVGNQSVVYTVGSRPMSLFRTNSAS